MEPGTARRSDDPAVVVTNPDEVVTPQAFQAWLDRHQRGEPLELAVSAADTLTELRASGEA